MRSRLLPMAGGAIAAAVVFGATAGGSQPMAKRPVKPTNLETSKDLWATINVCDTLEKPNTIGIRGSMPGLGDRRSRMQMRFQVQYKAKADGKWHNAGAESDSGYLTVGRTRGQVLEAGNDFTFAAPTDGGSHVLRGSIRYRWKRHGQVVDRARRFTEPGHKTTAGADPTGYSAAECEITAP